MSGRPHSSTSTTLKPRPTFPYSSRSLPLYLSGQEAVSPYYRARRPHRSRTLQSSPLATSFSADEASDEVGEIPKYRPSRISYTPPDQVITTASESTHHAMSDITSVDSCSTQSSIFTTPSSASITTTTASEQDYDTFYARLSKRLSQTVGLQAELLALRSSNESTPTPTLSLGAGRHDRRRSSPPSTPSRRPSTFRDPRKNWLSFTDPTPRFSRLGLGGEGVILPVSAKSHPRSSFSQSMRSTTMNSPPLRKCSIGSVFSVPESDFQNRVVSSTASVGPSTGSTPYAESAPSQGHVVGDARNGKGNASSVVGNECTDKSSKKGVRRSKLMVWMSIVMKKTISKATDCDNGSVSKGVTTGTLRKKWAASIRS